MNPVRLIFQLEPVKGWLSRLFHPDATKYRLAFKVVSDQIHDCFRGAARHLFWDKCLKSSNCFLSQGIRKICWSPKAGVFQRSVASGNSWSKRRGKSTKRSTVIPRQRMGDKVARSTFSWRLSRSLCFFSVSPRLARKSQAIFQSTRK